MSKDRFQRPVSIICLILILLELATAVSASDVLSQTAGSTSLDLQPMTRSPLSDPSGQKSALAHDLATRKSILNDASNVEFVGQIGGVSHAVVVRDNFAYVATRGDGLRIIDISDPREPLETSFFKGEFEAFGVAVVGDYAYLAAVNSGLLIINVADRANPFEVGFALTYGNALKVAVAGNHAYISNGYGLSIDDISNPTSPTATYLSDSLGGSCNVAADDNYIYATSDKVSVINVSNASAPIEEGYFYPTWRLNCDVAAQANYIFLVGDGELFILHFPGSVSYLPLAISL